jgi:hypothetical protein
MVGYVFPKEHPMTRDTPTRRSSPKLWQGLALAGAAGLAAATPLAAGVTGFGVQAQAPSDARLWLAQAEAGEAGEAGAVADVSPEVAYLARLAIVEGHLVAAMNLYAKGMVPEAIGLAGHPEAEMMDEVRSTLAAHGADDFSDAMDAFSMAMADGAALADVQAALAVVHDGMAAAAARAAASPRVQFDALIALSRAAAAEYAGSIDGDTIADPLAFHEAQGFLQVAAGQAADLALSDDPVVAAAAVKALAAIDATGPAFAAIDMTPPLPGDPAVLVGAASTIEFVSYPVR